MSALLVASLALNVLAAIVVVVVLSELRQRDRHLKWVDERDQGVVHLFQKVAEAKVVPMTNPLDGMKQHGMITRNAVNIVYLSELDERLTHAQGFLRRALGSAKDLEAWEARNPAPPVSRWGKRGRKASVGKPIPTPEPQAERRTPSGQRLPDASPSETMKALQGTGGGYAIGEGSFGPEVGPHGAPRRHEPSQEEVDEGLMDDWKGR